MSTICGNFIPERTYATKRSRSIMTPKRTLMTILRTLVHIFAITSRTRSEAFGAITFKTSVQVGTGSVSAYAWHAQAFIVINTFLATPIKFVPFRTFASVRSVSINACSTVTYVRTKHQTFIEVFTIATSTSSKRTKDIKILGTFTGTSLTKIIKQSKIY